MLGFKGPSSLSARQYRAASTEWSRGTCGPRSAVQGRAEHPRADGMAGARAASYLTAPRPTGLLTWVGGCLLRAAEWRSRLRTSGPTDAGAGPADPGGAAVHQAVEGR